MASTSVSWTSRARLERVAALAALAVLLAIIAQALLQSVQGWLAGKALREAVPVFEAPIANAGKALGAQLTAWMPEWRLSTPLGPLDVRYTLAYAIYEWFKLPLLLFLTTYGMVLLRLSVSRGWLERSVGRNDLAGAAAGALLGMVTPVCSCTVTNLYAALAAGGASRRATAAFLFASPALNEFAIIFMFLIVGVQGGLLYVGFGLFAALLTAYLAPQLGLAPERFVGRAVCADWLEQDEAAGVLVRSFREAWRLFRRLLPVVLLSGAVAALLVNFNLTLVETLQRTGAQWWGPVVATLVGLPLDINAAATAPILMALRNVVPVGTLVAAMMATTVSSVAEWTMLHRLLGARSAAKAVLWFAGYVMALGLALNWLLA